MLRSKLGKGHANLTTRCIAGVLDGIGQQLVEDQAKWDHVLRSKKGGTDLELHRYRCSPQAAVEIAYQFMNVSIYVNSAELF